MTISVSDNTPRKSYTVAQGTSDPVATFQVDFEFFADADLNRNWFAVEPVAV